jgi:hypothetical protein
MDKVEKERREKKGRKNDKSEEKRKEKLLVYSIIIFITMLFHMKLYYKL